MAAGGRVEGKVGGPRWAGRARSRGQGESNGGGALVRRRQSQAAVGWMQLLAAAQARGGRCRMGAPAPAGRWRHCRPKPHAPRPPHASCSACEPLQPPAPSSCRSCPAAPAPATAGGGWTAAPSPQTRCERARGWAAGGRQAGTLRGPLERAQTGPRDAPGSRQPAVPCAPLRSGTATAAAAALHAVPAPQGSRRQLWRAHLARCWLTRMASRVCGISCHAGAAGQAADHHHHHI